MQSHVQPCASAESALSSPGVDLAVEFIALMAVRTGEARCMRVREIDFKEKL
jgi:hypothetical protein